MRDLIIWSTLGALLVVFSCHLTNLCVITHKNIEVNIANQEVMLNSITTDIHPCKWLQSLFCSLIY